MPIKKLQDLTSQEERKFNVEINNQLEDFLPAIPNVELGDTTDGKLIKLRAMPYVNPGGVECIKISDILFELQWRLYLKKKEDPFISKIIISNLELTPIIPNATFRRGVTIRIKFE